MRSIYHILDKHPAIYKEDMQIEYESLANKLVNSGKLRIDTDYYSNFVRYSDAAMGINIMLSIDELTKPNLIIDTKSMLRKRYIQNNKKISDSHLNLIISDLKQQTKKLLPVSDELRIRLTRIFVQSAHPIVIKWLLMESVEIFITYSHNIGDMMDISTWQRAGSNSGMQSTDGSNVCIYVSCGGDPFAKNNKKHLDSGNGWAAVARLQIIAGQEIGHYADIIRDKTGKQISRHSANFSCTKPSPKVRAARKSDIIRCRKLYETLLNGGMRNLIDQEKQLKFYDSQKIDTLNVSLLKIRIKYQRYKFLQFAEKNKFIFIKRFKKEKYMGLMISAMIEDMQTHISPQADVYRRSDKEAQEAISCAEALARVPQQVMKWGYFTTKATMHDLYKIYYNEVIPSLINNYNHLNEVHYKRNIDKHKKPLLEKIKDFALEFFSISEKEDKFKFEETREI